jgi:cobalt-zinc-cadmium efflux system protein
MRPLAIALGITAAFMIVEAIGGWVSGSLALLADAAHMATDVAALALALFAAWLAGRPPTRQRSYGFARAEILAALVNSALLGALTIWLFVETWQRLREPQPVQTGPMLWVAVAGLGANAVSAWVLSRGSGDGHDHGHAHGGGGAHSHDLNRRGALLHVLGDLLGSVAAIAAALIMMATGWWRADPILSGLIGFLVLWGAWRLMRESVSVLLEEAPAHIDAQAVHDAMVAAPGVAGVHDLHIWTVASGMEAMSAHVVLDGSRSWGEVLQGQNALLRERFGIGHATLQPEDAHCGGCGFSGR